MIRGEILEAIDNRRESPGKVDELLLQRLVYRCATQSRYVLEARLCPVVNDEERQEPGAGRIEPPDVGVEADQGEQEGGSIEDDIGFTVLKQD